MNDLGYNGTWEKKSRLIALGAALLISIVYFGMIAIKYPWRNWFNGADQSLYLRAARAWATGNLDPSQHYYPSGYPLLAAPFTGILSAQPFIIGNFLCFIASFWIFIRICRYLTVDTDKGQVFGTIAFLVATLSSPKAVTVWIWPWSTTGSAPFILGALLGALHYGRKPRRITLFYTMASGATVALFRPTDALIVLLAAGLFITWNWVEKRVSWPQIAAGAAFAAVGAIIPLLVFVAAHTSIFGFSLGFYLSGSAKTGFNLYLLPWRWVALVIDPRPLFPEGVGLARVFPWIIPGIAGMVLCISRLREKRVAPHVLVIGAMTGYWVLYLTYVDLQPYGLWRYSNYHYFKISQPFLAFYALLLVESIVITQTRRRAVITLIVTVAALFLWRPELRERSPPVRSAIEDEKVIFNEGLSHTDDVAIVPAYGEWTDIYMGDHHLMIDGQVFSNSRDFKAFPADEGAMIIPLHKLPEGRAELKFFKGIKVDAAQPVLEKEIHIAFGFPCLFSPIASNCGER